MPYACGCRSCGGPIVGDEGEPIAGTRCKRCRDERNREAAALRAYRRDNELCLTCGAAVARSKLQGSGKRVREPARYCKTHLAYYASRGQARTKRRRISTAT